MKGAEAVAQILKQEGVENFFCFPINPIIETAAAVGIRPIIARTERTVVGMADAYTRVNNGKKIGVCGSQFGPGVESAFGGVAQAYSDSTPILFLPAGTRQDRLGSEPVFDAVKNFQYVTKWAGRPNSVGRVEEYMRRAFTFLRAGRPGPVLLEMPVDVMNAELEELRYSPVSRARSVAEPSAVREAVAALVAAKRPLIHAGVGILYAEAWAELTELAELLQAPVMTTLQGKSAFPDDHPLSLGGAAATGSKALARWLEDSDLVFGAGSGMAISSYDAPIPPGKVGIQLTVDERDMNRDYATRYLLLGDAKLTLTMMIEEAKRVLGPEGRKGDEGVAREVASLKKEWLEEWMPKLTDQTTPINPYRVIWDLQQAVDLPNTIATHDAGTPRDHMVPFWKATAPNSYVGWGKSTHLGYGIPVALGAKVARPEKTVINVMGDLAFGMSGLDIETGVRNKIGITTVVFANGIMGDYDKHLHRSHELYGTRFIGGDHVKIAEGLGAYAERVEAPGEIIAAMKRAEAANREGRPALLEMVTREETAMSKYWG